MFATIAVVRGPASRDAATIDRSARTDRARAARRVLAGIPDRVVTIAARPSDAQHRDATDNRGDDRFARFNQHDE